MKEMKNIDDAIYYLINAVSSKKTSNQNQVKDKKGNVIGSNTVWSYSDGGSGKLLGHIVLKYKKDQFYESDVIILKYDSDNNLVRESKFIRDVDMMLIGKINTGYYPNGDLKFKTRRNFNADKVFIGKHNAIYEYYSNRKLKSKARKEFDANKVFIGELNIVYEYYQNGEVKSKTRKRFDAENVFIGGVM